MARADLRQVCFNKSCDSPARRAPFSHACCPSTREVASCSMEIRRELRYSDAPTRIWGLPMSKKGITGHDDWVLTEALATALVALEQLDPKHQPNAHMDDIRKMLANGKEPAAVSLHL